MLGKLLKYDIKAEFKSILPIYLVALVMPIAIRLMGFLVEHFPALNTFLGLLLFMYVLVIIGVFAWTLVVAVKHFYNHILKDEGYLTNTLPVKRSHIILSKEIVSLITFVVSTFVVILSLILAINDSGFNVFIDIISEILSIQYGINVMQLILWSIVTMLITYVSQVQIFYLAMLLGQTRNTNKVLFSFVFGIIIYIVMQIISTVSVGVCYMISPEMMDIFNSSTASFTDVYDATILILGVTIVLNIICLVAMHYISVYVVNRKLNLE